MPESINLISIVGNAETELPTFVKGMFGARSVTELSRGCFGKTFYVELQDGTKAVVKQIRNWNEDSQQPDALFNEFGISSNVHEMVLHEVRMHQMIHKEKFNVWPVVPVVLEVKDLNNRAHSTYFTLQKMVEGGETQEKVSSLVDFINDPETEFDCRLASFLSALDIIESMYERGFIHLDFHPGNFLVSLSLDGVNVYPIDFGLTFTIDDDCITRHQGDGAAAAPCQKFYDSFRAKLTGFKQNACDICCSWVKTTLSKLSIDNLKVEVERLIGVFSITREIADSILRFLANGEADSAILATSVYMEWKVSQYISLPVYNSAISYSEQFRTFKQNVIHGLEFFCNKVGIDLSSSRNLQAQIEHIPENNELKAVGDKLSTISQNYTTSSFYSKFVETARKYAIDGHVKDTEFIYTNKQGFKVKIIREKVLRGYVKQIYDGELLIGEKRKAKSGSTIFGNKTYSRLDKIYIQSSLIKKYFTFGSDIQNRQLIADKITKLGLIFTKQKVLDLYAQIQKDTNSYYSYDGVYNRRRNYDRLLHENWEHQKLIVKYWNKRNPIEKITIQDILKIQRDAMPWFAKAQQFDKRALRYFESKLENHTHSVRLCDDDPRSFEYKNTGGESIKITMLPNGRYSKTYVDSTIEGMVDEGTIKSATIFFRKDGRIDRKLTSSKMLELMENKIKIKFLDKDIARAEDLSSTAWTQRRRDRFFGEYNSKSAVRDDLRQTVEGQKQRRKNN